MGHIPVVRDLAHAQIRGADIDAIACIGIRSPALATKPRRISMHERGGTGRHLVSELPPVRVPLPPKV